MDHREEVGDLIGQRLEALGITASDLARRADVSIRTIQTTVAGSSKLREDKRAAIERVLQLRPGSLRRSYRTGEPFETTDGETVEDIAAEVTISRRDYEALLELADRLREQYGPPAADRLDDRRDRTA